MAKIAPPLRPVAERNRLIEDNVGLAYGLAWGLAPRYRSRGLTDDEVLSSCLFAMIRAAELWDPATGFKFSTYATTCMYRQVQSDADESRPIRVPAYKLHGARKRLTPFGYSWHSLTCDDEDGRSNEIYAAPAADQDFIDAAEEDALVERLLATLDAEDRSIVEDWMNDVPGTETAKRLGARKQNVYQRRDRVLARLIDFHGGH